MWSFTIGVLAFVGLMTILFLLVSGARHHPQLRDILADHIACGWVLCRSDEAKQHGLRAAA